MNSKIVFLLLPMLLVGALSFGSALGQGGTGRVPTPSPSPSTKQPAKSSQPVKRSTTSSRGGRSTSTAKESGDGSATLNETLDFIKNKMTVYAVRVQWGENAYMDTTFTSLGRCQVQINTKDYNSVDGREVDRQSPFSLSDMNLEGIEVKKLGDPFQIFQITLKTYNSREIIDALVGRQSLKLSFVNFFVSTDEVANQISGAFKHAIKLCGGKGDSF